MQENSGQDLKNYFKRDNGRRHVYMSELCPQNTLTCEAMFLLQLS